MGAAEIGGLLIAVWVHVCAAAPRRLGRALGGGGARTESQSRAGAQDAGNCVRREADISWVRAASDADDSRVCCIAPEGFLSTKRQGHGASLRADVEAVSQECMRTASSSRYAMMDAEVR